MQLHRHFGVAGDSRLHSQQQSERLQPGVGPAETVVQGRIGSKADSNTARFTPRCVERHRHDSGASRIDNSNEIPTTPLKHQTTNIETFFHPSDVNDECTSDARENSHILQCRTYGMPSSMPNKCRSFGTVPLPGHPRLEGKPNQCGKGAFGQRSAIDTVGGEPACSE